MDYLLHSSRFHLLLISDAEFVLFTSRSHSQVGTSGDCGWRRTAACCSLVCLSVRYVRMSVHHLCSLVWSGSVLDVAVVVVFVAVAVVVVQVLSTTGGFYLIAFAVAFFILARSRTISIVRSSDVSSIFLLTCVILNRILVRLLPVSVLLFAVQVVKFLLGNLNAGLPKIVQISSAAHLHLGSFGEEYFKWHY